MKLNNNITLPTHSSPPFAEGADWDLSTIKGTVLDGGKGDPLYDVVCENRK